MDFLKGEVIVGPFADRPGFPGWLQSVIFYRPAPNTAPAVGDIPNQTTYRDTLLGPVAFTVGDEETDPAELAVTAVSSNQTILPNANITLGGSGADRTITMTPAAGQLGTTTVTVTVTDAGDLVAQDTFTLTVVVPVPVASFTGTPTSGTDPVSVTFTDASTDPVSWLWERNSGSGWSTFSTSQNPVQSFAAGTWSVRLTATNASGSNTQTRTSYLTIAAAGIALVSHTIQGTGAHGGTTTAIDTTGATLLVVGVSSWANRPEPVLTDSKGNVWVPSVTGFDASFTRLYYCANPVVGTGHTFTLAGVECFASICVSAWSGAKLVLPLDQTAGSVGGGSHTAGPVTPSEAGELVYTIAGANNSGGNPGTINSPLAVLGTFTGGAVPSVFALGHAYEIQTTATARSATWSGGVNVILATFKKA